MVLVIDLNSNLSLLIIGVLKLAAYNRHLSSEPYNYGCSFSELCLYLCRFSLPKGLIAAPDVACRTSFASSTVENSRDLRNSLDTSAHVSGGGWGVSFSASTEYKQASSSVETGKYKIIFSTADCKYYFSKLNELELP